MGAGTMVIENGASVAFLGDSITQFGWEEKPNGYVQLVLDGLREAGVTVRAIPAGVGGNTSREMLARLPEILAQKPTWMFLNCGINDSSKLGLAEFAHNVAAIAERTAAVGTRLVVMTPTIGADEDLTAEETVRRKDYAAVLRQLSIDNNLLLVDLNTAMAGRLKVERDAGSMGLIFTHDGTHLNGLGNHLVAAEILETLGVPEAVRKAQQVRWMNYPFAVGMPEVSVTEYFELEARAEKERQSVREVAGSIVSRHLEEGETSVRSETLSRAGDRDDSPAAEAGGNSAGRVMIVSGQYFEMPSGRPSGYARLLADELALQKILLEMREKRKTAQMLCDLKHEVVPPKHRLVVLIPGTADFGPSETCLNLTEFSENVAAATAFLRSEDISTLLVTSLWVNASFSADLNDRVAESNAAIRELAQQNQIPLFDFAKAIEAEAKTASLDGGVVAKCLINQMLAAGLLNFLGFDEPQVANARARWLRKSRAIRLPPLISVRDFGRLKSQTNGTSVNDVLAAILQQKLLN